MIVYLKNVVSILLVKYTFHDTSLNVVFVEMSFSLNRKKSFLNVFYVENNVICFIRQIMEHNGQCLYHSDRI